MRSVLILLIGFFMLPASSGLHLDYAFCDGMLDHIDFFHHETEEGSCCDDPCSKSESDCCSEEEVFLESSIDVLSFNSNAHVVKNQLAKTFNWIVWDLTPKAFHPTFSFFNESVPIDKGFRQSASFLQVFLC